MEEDADLITLGKLVFYQVPYCSVFPFPLIKEEKVNLIWGGGDEILYTIPRYINVSVAKLHPQLFNLSIMEYGEEIERIFKYFKVLSITNITKKYLVNLLLTKISEDKVWKAREDKDFRFYGLLSQYLLLEPYNIFEVEITEKEIKINGKTFKIVPNY
jgi:hypothetical protein